MRKGIALLRASSPRQHKSGLGLDVQRNSVDDYAARNRIKIVDYFIEVKSGLSISRPVLESVLEACKMHDAVLLIAKIDRLSRRLIFIATLMESDIKFVAVDKPYADEYDLHLEAANAQRESRLISKRTREALQAAKRRGTKLGTAIFKLHRRQRLAYKQFAKKLKPQINRYWNQGHDTVRKLTAILNEKHIKTFQGHNTHWHLSTVHRLLKEIKFL